MKNYENDAEETPKEPFLDTLEKDIISFMDMPSVSGDSTEKKRDSNATEKSKSKTSTPHKLLEKLNFNLTPKEVKAHLDRYVVKQEEAKKVLSIAICDHFNVIKQSLSHNALKNYTKQNVVMMGPTGVGKTFMVKCLAELVGVPFIKSDATKFTETGYIGQDVEDIIRQLVVRANDDIELAEFGIVYLDEIDKIAASTTSHTKDVSGRGVQTNLLKLMEETDVPLKTAWDINSQLKALMSGGKAANKKEFINTKHILFIVSGAFNDLDTIIQKRLQGTQYGFGHTHTPKKETLLNDVATQDLVSFGLEPEFVGRLPVRVVCNPLTEKDLYHILTESESSILKQYSAALSAYNIDVAISDEALFTIARTALKEETGARGLATVLEKIFRPFKYELPSTDIRTLPITKETIDNPGSFLNSLLKNPEHYQTLFYDIQFNNFELNFFKTSHLKIQFDQNLKKTLVLQSLQEEKPITELCQNIIDQFEYAFRLVTNKSNQPPLVISTHLLNSIESSLDTWIKHGLTDGS